MIIVVIVFRCRQQPKLTINFVTVSDTSANEAVVSKKKKKKLVSICGCGGALSMAWTCQQRLQDMYSVWQPVYVNIVKKDMFWVIVSRLFDD